MKATQQRDVVVVGGGPAGSSAATFLAQQGHDVLLLERDKFPRYHIGESLMPETYWLFERLGVLDKLADCDFVRKHSVQFFGKTGKGSRPFYFSETNPHESAVTWQVTRSRFDHMLLENAREHGVEALEEARVLDLLMDGDRATGVTVQPRDGAVFEVGAKVVVDATGISALVAKKLRLRNADPRLKKAAVFGCFADAHRDSGIDEGATLILHTNDRQAWFWYIPLEDGVVSVGVVGAPDRLFADRDRDHLQILLAEVENCEPVRERLADARLEGEMHACSDFSYTSKKVAGPGYVMIGDAFGFLDPVYSTGVFLALKSAALAADSIHEALAADDLSGERLGSFGPTLMAGMQSFTKLVYAFYDDEFSFGRFIKDHPEYRAHLIDLLTGNVFREGIDDIFDAIEEWRAAGAGAM